MNQYIVIANIPLIRSTDLVSHSRYSLGKVECTSLFILYTCDMHCGCVADLLCDSLHSDSSM